MNRLLSLSLHFVVRGVRESKSILFLTLAQDPLFQLHFSGAIPSGHRFLDSSSHFDGIDLSLVIVTLLKEADIKGSHTTNPIPRFPVRDLIYPSTSFLPASLGSTEGIVSSLMTWRCISNVPYPSFLHTTHVVLKIIRFRLFRAFLLGRGLLSIITQCAPLYKINFPNRELLRPRPLLRYNVGHCTLAIHRDRERGRREGYLYYKRRRRRHSRRRLQRGRSWLLEANFHPTSTALHCSRPPYRTTRSGLLTSVIAGQWDHHGLRVQGTQNSRTNIEESAI